jgi:hypothetical protein
LATLISEPTQKTPLKFKVYVKRSYNSGHSGSTRATDYAHFSRGPRTDF